MSIPNQLIYSASATDNLSYKKLALKSLHVKDLVVNSHPLVFDKLDANIVVNTYNSSNVLVTADVFSLNIHAILVGDIVSLTLPLISYTATGTFNYFGFQLPADFFPNTTNTGLLLVRLAGVSGTSKFIVTSTGQVQIFKDLASTDFANLDAFASSQQTILYDNTN